MKQQAEQVSKGQTIRSCYFRKIQQEILNRNSTGFILRNRAHFEVHKIANMDEDEVEKEDKVLKNIETEYYSREMRSTYKNRRLLTRERFRATWGDEIALSKRLLLIG